MPRDSVSHLKLDDVSGDGRSAVALGLGPLEVGVVLVPVGQLHVTRLSGLVWPGSGRQEHFFKNALIYFYIVASS